MKLIAAGTVAFILLAPHANAQNVLMINNGNRTVPTSDKPETVNITFQLTVPAPDMSSSTDMTKAMAAINQSLYDIINQECAVLTAVLKGDCKLSRLSTSGNFNETGFVPAPFVNRPNNGPVLNATATAAFEIAMKPAAAAAPSPQH